MPAAAAILLMLAFGTRAGQAQPAATVSLEGASEIVSAGGLAERVPASRADGDAALYTADAQVFYALVAGTGVFRGMDRTDLQARLEFQEPVSVVSFHGPWTRVRTSEGLEGYVDAGRLSDVWIRVVKSRKTVYVYRGEELESEIPADMSYNFFTDKKQRGGVIKPDHWRTPEGRFYVVARNPNSQFHRAWVLNYPTPEDADRGLEEGIISEAEHRDIAAAAANYRMPPMGTALGGYIEIHGRGTGARTSWTRGCVAIPDAEIDRLWDLVKVGTPVVVER